MGGENVFYSLRPNKFVERQLFVELLSIADPGRDPNERVYISLGGLQLEDHRLVHCRLGIKNLISIEADPTALQRQLFNRRPSFILCKNCTTGDFVQEFSTYANEYNDKSFIIWLDYTSPQERYEQLVEYQTLLGELGEGDILKITINVNSQTLGEFDRGETAEEFHIRRKEKLRTQLDEYYPSKIPEQLNTKSFPYVMCRAVRKAALKATQGNPNLYPIPIAIFVYRDGPHPILTVTVHLGSNENNVEFCRRLETSGWNYLPSDWDEITIIKVPNLTAKERLYIEGLLVEEEHEIIHEMLPFRLDEDETVSLEMFQEYARHYCRYPSFFVVPL